MDQGKDGGPKPKKHRGSGGGGGESHRHLTAHPAASPTPALSLPLPEGGVQIDGSMLEGGGQILRNASALAAILGKPLKVDSIRAGRDKPGLRPQHLTGLQLISELCSGTLLGGEVGSSCITLSPETLVCGTHVADTRTAGSCMLLAQSALPCLLFAAPRAAPPAGAEEVAEAASPGAAAEGPAGPGAAAQGRSAREAAGQAAVPAGASPAGSGGAQEAAAAAAAALQAAVQQGAESYLDLKGGTDAAMAPPAGYMQHVLLPVLHSQLGVRAQMQLERRGFFPRGQGHVALTVHALPAGSYLLPINLTERGEITAISIQAFTAGRVAPTVGERLAAAAQKEVKSRMPRCGVSRQTPISLKVVHEPRERAVGDGCGILISAHSSTGCVFGASGLGERGVPAEAIGERAAGELMDVLASGACTDEWLQDQLVIFMALARGHSQVLTGEPTLHTRTACMVATAMTGAKFRITQQRGQEAGRPPAQEGLWLIECEGAAVPAAAHGQ